MWLGSRGPSSPACWQWEVSFSLDLLVTFSRLLLQTVNSLLLHLLSPWLAEVQDSPLPLVAPTLQPIHGFKPSRKILSSLGPAKILESYFF